MYLYREGPSRETPASQTWVESSCPSFDRRPRSSLSTTFTISLLVPNSLHQLKELSKLLVCSDSVSQPESLPRDIFQHTTHLVQLGLIQLLTSPIITFQLLRVELPLCQEPDLPLPVSAELVEPSSRHHSLPARHPQPFDSARQTRRHTICNGFSAVRCARNSFFTYESPSTRICGSSLRWTRRIRRYSCSGGSSARASLRLDLEPIEAGVAMRSRWARRMVVQGEVDVRNDIISWGNFGDGRKAARERIVGSAGDLRLFCWSAILIYTLHSLFVFIGVGISAWIYDSCC